MLRVGGGGGEVQGGVALAVGPVQLHPLALQHLQQHVHVTVEHGRVQGGVPRPGEAGEGLDGGEGERKGEG